MVSLDLKAASEAPVQVATCVCRHSLAAHAASGSCAFCRCASFQDPVAITRSAMEGLPAGAAMALELLKAQSAFKNVKLDEIRKLVETGHQEGFAKGAMLIRQGDVSDCVHVILHGQVKVEQRTHTGSLSVAELGPGEVVGEMGVLVDDVRHNSVIAQTAVETLRIEAGNARKVFDGARDILEAFVSIMQRRNRQVSARSWG